jgi:hypothetical protein
VPAQIADSCALIPFHTAHIGLETVDSSEIGLICALARPICALAGPLAGSWGTTRGATSRRITAVETYASIMALPIPASVSDITPEWLTDAFAESGTSAVPVAAVNATRIGEGVGFIGEIHRIAITYTDPVAAAAAGAPSTVVSKIPTQDPGGRMIGTMLRLYEKESGFYRHLAKDSPVAVPACFYNGADVDNQQWCLLLEDMHAYEVGDQLQPCNLDQARTLISAMAKIHARWGDGRADELTWLPRIDDPSNSAMVAMYDDCLPIAMARYSHMVPEYMTEWGKRFAPHALKWVSDYASQPNTVTHGDFRTDNIVFSPTAPLTDFAFLDWQLTGRGPGATDLYYFLALSLDPDVSCGHFDELVDLYLAEVTAAGSTPPSRDVLLHQMRGIGLFYSVLGVVTMATLDTANARGEELFLSMWKRAVPFAERLDLSPALPD